MYLGGKTALKKGDVESGIHLLKIGHEINKSNINILETLA